MDKYDVMRAIEGLGQKDRMEVSHWMIRTFSTLQRPRSANPKEPTILERVLAALTAEPIQLKEIVVLVYGDYTASHRQLVHSRLSRLLTAELVVRRGYGMYSLPIDEEA